METKDREAVLERLYNWKFRQAYETANKIVGWPADILNRLGELAERFDDCGWQAGDVFDEARNKARIVAMLMGYEFDDEKDEYRPIVPNMKIGDWLQEHITSHEVYNSAVTKASFTAYTGRPAPEWPEISGPDMLASLRADPGASIGAIRAHEQYVVGYQLACFLERHFAKSDGGAQCMGRGFAFRAAVFHLQAWETLQ